MPTCAVHQTQLIYAYVLSTPKLASKQCRNACTCDLRTFIPLVDIWTTSVTSSLLLVDGRAVPVVVAEIRLTELLAEPSGRRMNWRHTLLLLETLTYTQVHATKSTLIRTCI